MSWFKFWIAGYSRFSYCWMGLHKWDYPDGHCVKCGKCDEFFGPHEGKCSLNHMDPTY